MPVFFSRHKDTRCGVIVDIGSGSVAAGIVLSRPQDALPEIVYTRRELIPPRRKDGDTDYIRSMRQALFSAITEIEHTGLQVLKRRGTHLQMRQILVSVGAPWSHAAAQIIRFEKDAPFAVTKRLVDELVEQAGREEEKHAPAADALETAHQRVTEKAIIDITLNGYSVDQPYGKEASELTIARLRGTAAAPVLVAVGDVKRHLAHIGVRTHTSALVLYCTLRDLYPGTKNALVVDVSGEATQILLIRNAVLYESITAPYGTHTLAREIARRGRTLPEEGQAHLRAYKRQTLAKAREETLARVQADYAQTLGAACEELSKRFVLPKTLFCFLDEQMGLFFADAIERAICGGPRPKKELLVFSPEHARRLAVLPEGAPADPHLSMLARFFHKLNACGEMDTAG